MSSASAEHHYGDEILVAYLDRELPGEDRDAVEKHLGECWSCRTRAAEIEQDVYAATRALEWRGSREEDEIKRAIRTFHVRRAEFESQRPPTLTARWVLPGIPFGLKAAVAGAVLAGAVIGAIWSLNRSNERPEVIVAQATVSEKKLHATRQPSHQVLRVEGIAPSESAPKPLGALEIWSESDGGGRYSSRWTDARNNLRHAVWKPSAASYAYDPEARRAVPCHQPARAAHLVDSFAEVADLDSVEDAFLRWVRSRTWTLVSLAEEWAVFADREGVRVVVERLRDGRRNSWKLSASRVQRDQTLEMILQVDAETYLPRVQAVRMKSNGRIAELRLTLEQWQSISPLELQPAVFSPAPSIPVWERRTMPPAAVAPAPPPLAAETVTLPEWALAELELRLRLALHEALECVDVSVRREPGSGIVIQSDFSDGPRLDALHRILDGVEGRDYITVVGGAGNIYRRPSHVDMIRKHARLLVEIAGSARQTEGLSLFHARQLARLFADHRRGLRLEMAHLEAKLRDFGPVAPGGRPALPSPAGDITDIPVAPYFLGSEQARSLVSRINSHAAALADGPDLDTDAAAGIARLLPMLEADLLSLENSLRALWTQASH